MATFVELSIWTGRGSKGAGRGPLPIWAVEKGGRNLGNGIPPFYYLHMEGGEEGETTTK